MYPYRTHPIPPILGKLEAYLAHGDVDGAIGDIVWYGGF